MASPHFDTTLQPAWIESVVRQLESGYMDKLTWIKIKALESALYLRESGFIGPLRKFKKKEKSGKSKAWDKNRDSLHAMQAARPLKPPGR